MEMFELPVSTQIDRKYNESFYLLSSCETWILGGLVRWLLGFQQKKIEHQISASPGSEGATIFTFPVTNHSESWGCHLMWL